MAKKQKQQNKQAEAPVTGEEENIEEAAESTAELNPDQILDLLKDDDLDADEAPVEEAPEEGEGEDGESEEPPLAAKEETQEEAPPEEGKEPPAEPKLEAKPEEAAEEKEVAPVEKEQQAEPAAEPVPPEKMEEDFRNWRENAEEALATGVYQVSKEQLDELDEDLGKALPKLMARVHTNAYLSAVTAMNQMLPGMIKSVNDRQAVEQQAEQNFQKAWPQLDLGNQAHRTTVEKIGSTYRNMNPSATTEDFIKHVGAQAIVALQLPVQAKEEAPQAKPYRPSGNSAPAAQKPAPTNPYEQMALEEEQLDLD